MNKLILGILSALLLISVTDAIEYRTFTNESGKAIVARVVEYDAKGGRVLLELKNRKKAWVELSTLSEADQAYICSLKDSPADPLISETAPLSKKSLIAIGERYIKAVETQAAAEMEALLLNPKNLDAGMLSKLGEYTTRIWIAGVDIDGGWIELRSEQRKYTDKLGYERSHPIYASPKESRRVIDCQSWGIRHYHSIWLMTTPSGKIKYDSFMCPHPLQIINSCILFLEYQYENYALYRDEGPESLRNWESAKNFYLHDFKRVEAVYQELCELSIPLQGLNLSLSQRKFEKEMGRVKEWVVKNGEEWDISNPEVYISEDLFDRIKHGLK